MSTIFSILETRTMAIAAAAIMAVLLAAGPAQVGMSAYGQEAQPDSTTIKVSGEASASIAPDEATITIGSQIQPDELSAALEQQQEKIQQITDAVEEAAGNDTLVTVGQQSINPFYSGYGTVPSDNITFNVYASVGISASVDQLPDLVQSLAEAGFGFESVYFDPSYPRLLSGVSPAEATISPASLSGNGSVAPAPPAENQTGNESAVPVPPMENQTGNETQGGEELSSSPVTISVSLITEPGTLEDAIAEYDEKYQTLLDIVGEVGLSEDAVQINYFNIQPVFYGSSPSDSYSAYTQLVVRTNPENIEAITDAMQEVGDAYVENVFMSISDSAIDSAREELSQQAMESARDRADEIAAQLGLEVQGIESVDASAGTPTGQYPGEIRTYRGVQITPYYYYQYTTGQVSVSMVVEFAVG